MWGGTRIDYTKETPINSKSSRQPLSGKKFTYVSSTDSCITIFYSWNIGNDCSKIFVSMFEYDVNIENAKLGTIGW